MSNRLIEIDSEEERVVLLSAPGSEVNNHEAKDHLAELKSLTDTAGASVVATLQQKRHSPHPAYFIGTGKVEDLRETVAASGASLVVFDEDLSPAQGHNLEQALQVRVMDRTELIIDIFALRARTAEAKMQVELAQLQYLMPRLTRMWNHLSRIRGGIGLRGPGETQLETDRRTIRQKIRELKKRLEKVARQRETQRKGRAGEFRIALVGYTNAGKSSILAGLSGSELFVEDRLFATLDPATRVVDLGEGYRTLVTDTVGLIRKLPHHLIASFRATLEEVNETDLLCHVVDVAHAHWDEQYEVVEGVVTELQLNAKGRLIVFNKVDRLTHAEQSAIEQRAVAFQEPHVFTSTAETGGLDRLCAKLRESVREQRPMVQLVLAAGDGGTLAEIYREGEVIASEERGASVQVTARLPLEIVGRLRSRDGVSLIDVHVV